MFFANEQCETLREANPNIHFRKLSLLTSIIKPFLFNVVYPLSL